LVSAGLSMVPGIGTVLGVARAADYGMSAYEASQLAPSRDARERSQDQFRAFEIADMNAPQYGQAGPEYGPAPAAIFDPNSYEGGFIGNQAFNSNARNMGGGFGAPNFTYADDSKDRLAGITSTPSSVGAPIAPRSSFAGESLPSMATDTIGQYAYMGDSGLQSGGLGQTGLYGDAEAGMGDGYGGFGGVTGGADTMGFGGEYAHGGMVDARHLKGRAPAPDDGYGALQGGEYVITKAAVEKYGKRLLDAINNGTFR